MEELGRALIGDDYDHLLGYGFFKAKEHDRIPMSKGIIARDDSIKVFEISLIWLVNVIILILLQGQSVYKAGYIIQKAFVNKYGKILPKNKRKAGYKSDDWDVFVPTVDNKTLNQGDEFLYCKFIRKLITLTK